MHYYYYNFNDLVGILATLGPAFILWFIVLPGILLALLILMFLRLLRASPPRGDQYPSASSSSFHGMEKNKQLIQDLDNLMSELEERVRNLEQKQAASPVAGEARADRQNKGQE